MHQLLTAEEEKIILHKQIEKPFSGKYVEHNEHGVYTCKCCAIPLFQSQNKFDAHCG